MLKIKVLPANCGDCILISFDDGDKIKNIIIDGGVGTTYRKYLKKEILNIQEKGQIIDLLVITHSHEDHINGIIKFLEDDVNNKCIKKVWFNSSVHFDKEKVKMLTQDDNLDISIRKIKYLEDKLIEMKFMKKEIWNNKLVKQGDIEKFNNAKITVLSPDEDGLDELKNFTEELRNLDIAGKEYDFSTKIDDFDLNNFKDEQDDSIENKTSISFMFEYNEKRLLFLADAFPNTVLNGLKETRLLELNKKIDYVKLSHHASKGNLNNELLEAIDCTNYIVSTNGLCSNKLPNKKTFARIIKYHKNINLFFNYKIENIFFNGELNTPNYKINVINLDDCLNQIVVEK